MKKPTQLSILTLTISLVAFCSISAFAQVTTSKLFRSGAVLQREVPIPVWGWGDSGETVTVTFADSVRSTTVQNDGTWKLYLPSFNAGGPYSMTVSSGTQSDTYSDIMVGDVYMISGQSNMEWSLSASDGGILESATANYNYIREFKINKATSSEISDNLGTANWKKAASGVAGTFSAVGYYFAKEIFLDKGIAIGLINNSYGGARIEAFMSEQMLGFDETEVTLANGETERQPTLIYNKMVHPVLPFAYKGILWYQAESNGDSMEDALEYGSHFTQMITAWRDSIGLGDLPFLWVQLPNFGDPIGDTPSSWDAWPQLRAQQSSALSLPNTGEAITIDVGGVDIHPTNKEPVGYRLSLLAQKIIYGEDIVAHSPRYKSNTLTDSGSVVVSFDSLGSGLTTPVGYEADTLTAFALAGENNQYRWAKAKIEGDQVIVWHKDIPEPKSVRYAWEYNPGTISLYNQEGLPVAPFQATINPGFGIATFRSARSAIEQDQSTTLSWEVFNASSVTLDDSPVDTAGTLTISPTETTTYVLVAINKDDAGETDTARVTVQVLDPAAINRTYGKQVFASTYETCCGEPMLPEYAIDEDMETRWSSAWSDGTGDNPAEPQYDGTPDDEWIAVDFGEYINIDQVILNWEAAYGSSYDIEVSLDGYRWNTVFEERSSDGGEDIIIFDPPAVARYLRLHGVERATEFGYSLFEFAAYGAVSDIQPPSVSLNTSGGNFIKSGESVTIKAETSDENGTVESVDFLVDGELAQSVTEAPFEFTLTMNESGSRSVSAIATDDTDITIQSSPLVVYRNTEDFTRFEAEDAITSGGATITNNSITSGQSYLDLQDAWTVTFDDFVLQEAGEHVVNIRYQLTYDSPKSQYLVLNGDTVATVEFTAPNLTAWLDKALSVNFEQISGNQLAIHGFWNWMSIDYIEVQGVNEGVSNEESLNLPDKVALHQNYPNPFNPETQIAFDLPFNDHIQLRVYDITGREIATLIDGTRSAGSHTIRFDASNLSSGMYFYQISGSFGVLTQKMTLIK